MIKPGTIIHYLCDIAPTDKRLPPHLVVGGPYLNLSDALAASEHLWHFYGRIVRPGVISIAQAAHGGRVAQISHGFGYIVKPSGPDHGTTIDKVGADLDEVADLYFDGKIAGGMLYQCDDPCHTTVVVDPNTGRRCTTTLRAICAEHLAAWHENGLGQDIRILGRTDNAACSECDPSSS